MKRLKWGIAVVVLLLCGVMAFGQTVTVTDVAVDEGVKPETKFVGLSVSLENNQSAVVTLENRQFSLLDSQDNFYEATSRLNGSEVWFAMRLNPLAKQTAQLWFEVPKSFDVNLKTVKLCLHGADSEVGGDYQEFPLRLKPTPAP
jgi:hypothetical protein